MIIAWQGQYPNNEYLSAGVVAWNGLGAYVAPVVYIPEFGETAPARRFLDTAPKRYH
jgi:hypothetical protein